MNKKNKFKFSILVSAIFALLVGLPFYGVTFYNQVEAKRDLEIELKKGQSYATKYAQIQLEIYISKISTFVDNMSINDKVLESFEKNQNIEESLSEIYDSESGVDIDFLFAHKLDDKNTINISSSIFNTDQISKNLNKPLLKLNKNIEITVNKEDGKTIVYAYAIRPIVSRDTGEVLGDITAGIILNNNLNMLEDLKDIKNLEDIDVYYKNEKILDLAHNPTAITEKTSNNQITIKGDKVIVPFGLTIPGADDIMIYSTFTSNSFSIVDEKYDRENFVLFFLILGLAIAFFIIFNILITSPLKKLVEYTRTPLEEITVTSPEFGVIEEFQKLGAEFHKAFARLAILNQGLEKEVKERTLEIEEKKDLLEKQLIEVKTLQDRMIAQEKLTSLGLLLAGVSHEIRNPLNLIQNSALILEEIVNEIDEEKDEKKRLELFEEHKSVFRDVSNIVIQHSQRSTRIIKSMLDQSRGSSAEKTLTDIKDVVLTNLNYINKATDTAFYLRTEIKKDFANIEPFYIFERELGQVIVNIFENSFYALMKKSKTENKDFTPQLFVTTTEESGYAVLKIRDNGIGIPKDILADIFKAFKTTKPAGEGTGLGLSVSKDIIRKHDGDILVNSIEGEFTEFTIKLPIRKKA